MPKRRAPNPLPEEDLGRGGEAATGLPTGTPGEREELSRGLVREPSARGPRRPEPPVPPSASR